MRAKLWAVILGGVLALVFLACANGGDASTPQDREFIRHCKAQGKVPHITHRGDSVSRTCDKAPQPTPNPGDRWQ